MRFGDFLMKHIFWAGMSQVDVAKKSGLTPALLNEVIKGKRRLTVKSAKGLEKALGIPAAVLMLYQITEEMEEE